MLIASNPAIRFKGMGDRCRKGPCPTCNEKLTGVIGSTQKSFGCIQKSCAVAETVNSPSKQADSTRPQVLATSILGTIPSDRVGSLALRAAVAMCPPELRQPRASLPPP